MGPVANGTGNGCAAPSGVLCCQLCVFLRDFKTSRDRVAGKARAVTRLLNCHQRSFILISSSLLTVVNGTRSQE
jgi:hypothetical protein